MKKSSKSSLLKTTEPDRRIVLLVDGDASNAEPLKRVWSELRLADELHVVASRDAALEFLDAPSGCNAAARIAAVVLDPETTGEETGAFLREMRKRWGSERVPALFWTRDGQKYEVLEGICVNSVLRKPMALRLVQVLDTVCQLRVQRFAPFAGSSVLAHSAPGRAME